MKYLKAQTVTDSLIWEIAVVIIVVATIGILLLFFNGSGNSLPVIQINSQYNNISNVETLQLFLPRKIANPKNISIYINNISTKISLINSSFYYNVINNTYEYNYTLPIHNIKDQALFSNTSSKIVLVSYLDSVKKIIYSSALNYKVGLSSSLSYSSGQYITFHIVPNTNSWEIILKNNSYSTSGQIISNGKQLYLPNGEYYLEAKQINSSTTLYFNDWYALPYYGKLSVSPNNTKSSILTVKDTRGIVSLYLGYSGLVTFSSNKLSQINSQNNFSCGENETRFCIDNSFRNLNFTYYENKSSFSFNYPQLLSGNAIERLAFEEFNTSFVNKATGEASCKSGFNKFNSSQTALSVGPTSCILYAQYVDEYKIIVNTSNSTQGDISVYTAYNGKTETGNKVVVWIPKGTSAQITANPNTYYQFSNWTETPGNQIITTNQYSFTVSGPANYTAHFKFNPPTISWTATSNLGSVTASFSANAIPSNSLKGWVNISSGTTPYTFTFNKSNVFSSNALNTSFTFNGAFASSISAQHGSQNSGSFEGITIYCGASSVKTFTSEAYSYNWKASNDCQNVTIEANYYLTPPPPPPPPPPPGNGTTTTSSGGAGFFNANMTEFLLKEIYPIGVGMNLTTSNMKIANFSVFALYNGKTYIYENPLISNGNDNFSFEQVDAHKSFSNSFNPTYGTSNGEIFQYIPNHNTTKTEITFPQKFVYNGYNYSFSAPESLMTFVFILKNGTKLSTTVPGQYYNSSKHATIALNTSFASYVFHNETSSASGINASYVESYTVNVTATYVKHLPHNGEITVINYPDDISNLAVSIPSSINYQEEQGPTVDFANVTHYLISSQGEQKYSLTVSAKLSQPDFKGEYILNVYDNTTKTSVDGYSNENVTAGTPITISNLLSNQTYTIWAIYYVPITIATNFLGKGIAFGNQNQYSPFKVNNFVGGDYYEVKSGSVYNTEYTYGISYYQGGFQNTTFFSYPSSLSSIGYTQPISAPTIQDGYWSNGNFNPDTPLIGSSGLTNCAETGEVGSCITFEGILPGAKYYSLYNGVKKKSVSSGPTLPTTEITISPTVYPGNTNQSCPSDDSCKETFGQGGIIEDNIFIDTLQYINPINYTTLSADFSNINVNATVNLNYGYYIPVYLGANANYSSWCSNAYYTNSYSSILNALQASANDNLPLTTCSDLRFIGRAHPIINLYMYNVNNTNGFFSLNENKITYLENKTETSTSCSDCIPIVSTVYYNLTNTPSGFTSTSPLIKDEGSSNDEYQPNYNIYKITASSYPSSWSVDNGYIFYEYDSG